MSLVLPSKICGTPSLLFGYVAATTALAAPAVMLALGAIAIDPPSAATAATVFLFFMLALLADLQPVPMDEAGKSEVSIANVFIVATAIL